MLRGEPLRGGWGAEAVKESLDLCLSCKGCKGECPLHVDMATYKAEFFSRYYRHHARPLSAHLFGRIDRWARLASHAPGLVNFLASTPPFSTLAKALGGIHPARSIPRFAGRTFQQRAAGRVPRNPGGPRVMLFADTFNNHYHPQTALAALELLERRGFEVVVSPPGLCCGRPLYEFGMLDHARAYLERLMGAIAPQIEAGTPLVVLEPACASVFRDELTNLLYKSEQARRLSKQTYLLDELLVERDHGEWPQVHRKAIVHGHCHHQSILKMGAQEELMKRAGIDYRVLDSGCCGMAGSFGFEKEKYDVSIACGERVLLPAVRAAPEGTLLIADGFSCREQVAQCTGRTALHLAQVLAAGPPG
jgi:Fe-S oxidoreductase